MNMTDYPKFLDEVARVFDGGAPCGGGVGQAVRGAAAEVRRLHAENASLWALARFGREMLSARNLSPIPLSGEQTEGLRAVINDLAELFDLLKIDPNSEILVETPLAQLPKEK